MSNFDSNETIQFTSSKPVYDFYVAGPYETAEQVESMERLEKVLNDRGMSVYRPRFAMDVNVSGPQAVFANRIAAIANSRAVIANMDDNDAGAVFALAYGYALGKPVYAYCEGILPNGRISLMALPISRACSIRAVSSRWTSTSTEGRRGRSVAGPFHVQCPLSIHQNSSHPAPM